MAESKALRRTGGIQEVDVWNAADAMLLDGVRPSVQKVRDRLGRGSPNTVLAYLDSWYKALGSRIRDPGAFSAVSQVPEVIAQAAATVWQHALAHAQEQADAEIAAREAVLAGLRAQAEARVAELEARERMSQESLQKAQEQAQAAANLAETLRGELRLNEDRLGRAQAEIAGARAELDQVQAEARRDRESAQARIDQAIQARAESERHFALEVDRAREAAKALQIRLATVEKEHAERHAQSQSKVTELERSLLTERQQAEVAAARAADLDAALQSAKSEAAQSAHAAAAREEKLTAQIAQLQTDLAGVLKDHAAKESARDEVLRSLVASVGDKAARRSIRRP